MSETSAARLAVCRPRCEAEIGGLGRWHACDRAAHVVSIRQVGHAVYTLHFCARHAWRAYQTESAHVRILRVEAIDVE